MESLATYFMLFFAGVSALITYLVLPRIPVVAVGSIAAVALVAGVWWHWNQFATEYRTSTWQESLRSWGSYIMVFAVIFLSYGVYAVTTGPSGREAGIGMNRNKTPRNSTSDAGSNLWEMEPREANLQILPTPNLASTVSNVNTGSTPNLGLGLNRVSETSGEESKPVNGVNFLT